VLDSPFQLGVLFLGEVGIAAAPAQARMLCSKSADSSRFLLETKVTETPEQFTLRVNSLLQTALCLSIKGAVTIQRSSVASAREGEADDLGEGLAVLEE
jgi:hypothetical protein